MTSYTPDASPVMPWKDPRFLLPATVIPLVTFTILLLWQSDLGAAFRLAQLCLAWAVVVQMAVILVRVFDRGWYELFAYLLHLVAIGAAALSVTFRLEQYPQDLLYDQLAVAGMGGQLMLGLLVLSNGPLRLHAVLDRNVMALSTVVVCSAALVKFILYIRYVGLAGGHFSIYTEGDAVRDNSPAIIRIIAAGAPLVGLLAITQPGLPRWCRLLGIVAIMLEFAIGIRGRPLYIMLAAIAIGQVHLPITPVRKILIVVSAALAVLAIGAIGYVREDNTTRIDEYFWMVLESLFGIFEAGVFSAQLPNATPLVLSQILVLLAPTPIGSIDTVAKLISVTYTQKAYLVGYGYSSSVLTEVTLIFGPLLTGFIYPLSALLIVSAIKYAVSSRRTWVFLYGASVLPIAFYIWRAELWQLAVPVIKALPFITVLLGFNLFVHLGRERRHIPTSASSFPS
jgi:hypothetical protein